MRRAWLGLLAVAVTCIGCTGKEAARPAPPPADTTLPTPPSPTPRLAVAPRTLAFDAVGDTARLTLTAGVTCLSASGAVAVADSTGLVRATGNGETHLRCWRGRARAIVRVRVEQLIARVGIVADRELAIVRGDSLRLRVAAMDRLGSAVAVGRAQWASLHPEIVSVDSSTGVAQGVADSGSARIVAHLDTYVDTVTVEVGRKPTAAPLARATTRPATARTRAAALRTSRQSAAGTITRPRTAGAPATPAAATARRLDAGRIGVRELRPSDSLVFRDPLVQRATRGWSATPSLRVTFADHGVLQAGALERNSGILFGAGADISGLGPLRISLALMTGSLAAQTTLARDQSVTLGRLDLGIAPAPWLSLFAGAESRIYRGLVDDRWVMLRAGGQAHFTFGDTPFTGVLGLQFLPIISRGTGNTSPSFGLNTAVGVTYERGRITTSLRYLAERYGFPADADRTEQFSGLEFRVGLGFSR